MFAMHAPLGLPSAGGRRTHVQLNGCTSRMGLPLPMRVRYCGRKLRLRAKAEQALRLAAGLRIVTRAPSATHRGTPGVPGSGEDGEVVPGPAFGLGRGEGCGEDCGDGSGEGSGEGSGDSRGDGAGDGSGDVSGEGEGVVVVGVVQL